MKTRFLFPHRFKKIGWVLLALAVVCLFLPEISFLQNVKMLSIHFHAAKDFSDPNFLLDTIIYNTKDLFNPAFLMDSSRGGGFFRIIETDMNLTIWCIIAIAGLLFVAFSRLKSEDEYISKIRLESLLWAMYINFILLIIATILFYGTDFLGIIFYNMFTPLIIFIIRFHILLIKLHKSVKHEK